ncbi:MAG: biotin/lipoyl-binding protein, partial [Gammaproteobacteria bacterium]|nr:biotin/lipoyl-binding protein [Gammaproteobacteria bacterium]
MADRYSVTVPDIGDFTDVEIIEVLVNEGDTVDVEAPLITLETDKAAMDVPAPVAGKIVELKIATGDKVSEGDLILILEVDKAGAADADTPIAAPEPESKPDEKPAAATAVQSSGYDGKVDMETEVVVLGSGPGGYTAAFRAADLGKK